MFCAGRVAFMQSARGLCSPNNFLIQLLRQLRNQLRHHFLRLPTQAQVVCQVWEHPLISV
jgi:hypothetical protein